MEKCVFFPTFSIFHALGSILTTGGVLGSWTLVKLLSSPLEEGRTNIKGQMGLGPQPIHEKWWWRKVDPQQIGNQLVMVSVCLVNIDELHVFVISWKIHFLLGTLWLHVSITNAIGNSLCYYLPVPRVIESVESEVATPALSQHSSLRRFLNKAPDLVNGTDATCTKQTFSSFFGEHPRDHWGTIRTNGCTFGFFRPGSTMQNTLQTCASLPHHFRTLLPTVQPINFDQTSNPHGIISGNLVKAKQPRGDGTRSTGYANGPTFFTPTRPLLLPNLTARWKREAFRVPASLETEKLNFWQVFWPLELAFANGFPLPFWKKKRACHQANPILLPKALKPFFLAWSSYCDSRRSFARQCLHHVGSLMVLV